VKSAPNSVAAACAALGALIGVCGPGPLQATQELPPLLRNVRIEQHLGTQVPPELEFRDETGRPVRLGDYFNNKPHVLVLAYYRCPKLCTLVLNGLRDAVRALPGLKLGDSFNIITVSFDPRETTQRAAEKKHNYMVSLNQPGAEEAWHFLTGQQAEIDRLTEAAGFYYAYDPREDQFAHASAIMILTPQGKISRYFYGVKYLPKDVRLGLVEASDRKIGSPVDAVLLYCYHYDPLAGKYTASVMNFVRLGGVLILVSLGGLGFSMWRRERLRPRAPAPPQEPAKEVPTPGP
jgi:protein SCO1/2